MDKDQLRKQYESYSNAKLLRILDTPGDYRPEALELVRKILEERDVGAEEISVIREEYEQEEEARRLKADKGLTEVEKAFLVVVPVVGWVLYAIWALDRREHGYDGKVKEGGKWVLYGVLTWIGLSLVAGWL